MEEKELNGNIKTLFKGYYDYDRKEFDNLVETAIIVPDTNVLLDLHRYTKHDSDLVIKAFKKYKDRLWIPYEVGKEYFNNKYDIIANTNTHYERVEKDFEGHINQMREFFDNINTFNTDNEISIRFKETMKKFESEFKELISHDKSKEKTDKEIEKFIIDLFENKIGKPNSLELEEKIKIEGLRRFEKNIPPGYKDKSKSNDNSELINGDYHIFASIIEYAKNVKRDVIFITNDTKEDMYLRKNGKTIKGRPELLNEFHLNTEKILQLYTIDQFLEKIYLPTMPGNGKTNKDNSKIIKNIEQFRKNDENFIEHKQITEEFELKNKEFKYYNRLYERDLYNQKFAYKKLINLYHNLSIIFEKIEMTKSNEKKIVLLHEISALLFENINFFATLDNYTEIEKYIGRLNNLIIVKKYFSIYEVDEIIYKIKGIIKKEQNIIHKKNSKLLIEQENI